MDSTRLKTEAPKLEWREDAIDSIASICGHEVGSYAYAPYNDIWLASFLADGQHRQTESEAKQWVETQWQAFYKAIHEAPYEGEDGA